MEEIQVGVLPTPRWGVTGASIEGILHVSGGSDSPSVQFSVLSFLSQIPLHIISGQIRWANNSHNSDAILSWDPVSETWDSAGHLETPRLMHSMTAIPLSVVEHFCKNDEMYLKT